MGKKAAPKADDVELAPLDRALDLLLAHEGGWSNHPADRGGATMYGVTQKVYDEWRQLTKQPWQSVRSITKNEARDLYERLYWNAAACDRMPWPISYMVFDGAVNSGVRRSVTWLQAALLVPADGIAGPQTISAIEAADKNKLVRELVDQRVVFLARLVQRAPKQATFLLGWWRRVNDVLVVGVTE